MSTDRDDDPLARLCSLDDPTRRRLFDHVARQDTSVTRDEAATALGLDRSTAAYHLDKLVEQGLLAVSFARPEGRRGPGAGRPAKHYEPVAGELSVSVPPRDYRLAAEVFARAAEQLDVRAALDDAARGVGEELAATPGSEGEDLEAFLARQGFEPYRDGDVVRLRNCPFHLLARAHTDLVCGMNLAMLTASVSRVSPAVSARLDPAPDRCCVAFDV